MINGRSVKLNKKYFFAALFMFSVQLVLGSNWANAKPCEAVITKFCSLTNSRNANWCYDAERTHVEMNAFINSQLYGFNEEGTDLSINSMNKHIESEKSNKNRTAGDFAFLDMQLCFIKTSVCMYKNGGRNQESNTFTDYKGCDGGSQPSNSGSSSQSNQKANRQTANNQSSSSNSSDFSKMNRDQLFTTINAAINSKDWVKAYAGLQQLSKDPDTEISRQALNKMGEYSYLGQGVKQNLGEATRLFEQSSSMGDLDAYAHLCGIYSDRKGAVNHKKAFDSCVLAAEKGHPHAQAVLGWLYHQGDGITQNIQLSNNWTCKAAAQGEATAVGNVKKQNISCN